MPLPHDRDTSTSSSLSPLTRNKASDMDQRKDAGDDRVCPLGKTFTTIDTSALRYVSDGFITPSISY